MELDRSSIGVEVEPTYVDLIENRLAQLAFNEASLHIVRAAAVTPVTKAAA
jgi:DNA modification methylase